MQSTSFQAKQPTWPWAVVTPAAQPLCDLVPWLQLVNDTLHLPFDAARSQHARAVQAGLVARSILRSRDFERAVDALERSALGPFARRV